VNEAKGQKHTHKLIYTVTSVFVQLFCSIIQIEAAQPEKKLGLSRPNPSLKRQANWQSQAYFGNPQKIGLSRLNPEGVTVTSLVCSHIETRMDRPKAAVGFIRGVVSMSAVFCGQVLASATSGQSATSRCLSVLPGRLVSVVLARFLDCLGWKKINQRTYYSHTMYDHCPVTQHP